MGGKHVEEKYSTESDMVDEVFGEFPFILYKHYFITSRNILKFCKEMTDIDRRMGLSEADLHTIEHLQILLVTRLHIITVRCFS